MADRRTLSFPPRRRRSRAEATVHTSSTGADAPRARKTGQTAPTLPESWRSDLPASLVLLLVALPLCLGIALASGAPLSSGLMAGVIGGIVVGLLSDSPLMVSGPAAGLTAIVLAGITTLGSFEAVLTATIIGGVLQIGLSVLRAGVIGYYFPSSVIRGMLAGIGVILILTQLPHAVGYDPGHPGNASFRLADGVMTVSTLGAALQQIQPGAALLCLIALAILALWPRVPAFRRLPLLPAPLVVVLMGVGLNALFGAVAPAWAIRETHLVRLPLPQTARDLLDFIILPDLSAILNPAVWRLGVTIAIVASLESLLSLEATDKLDPFKRESDTNRELLAQGVGNAICGCVGGLPVTGVIVRSAANIDAGAQTRWSGITHGGLLVIAVLTIPRLLNQIPLAALAAILLHTGYKLAAPPLWRGLYRLGRQQFVPFVTTVLAIVLTDLLIGIAVGMTVGLFFLLSAYLRQPALTRVSPPEAVLQRFVLPDQVTFLSKANIERTLEGIPSGARIEIDGRQTTRFDHDVLELLHDFSKTAALRGIDYRLVGVPALPAGAPIGH
jgi:MFS superfamily sulfate permease-like transporter